MKKEKSKVSAQGAAVINPNDEDIRFIDLRVDVAFKRVFGTPGNEELLKMLIDSILPDLHVRTLVLGNQENMGDNRDDKKTVFDIKATTEDGETVVIEMQLAEKKDFNDRLVYYSTYPIREQVRSGDKKYSLAPLYIIAIMDFSMDGDRTTDNVINSFCIRNDNDISRTLTDNVHYVTVELPKFKKSMSDLKTLSDRMIWLLRNMGSLRSVPENFKDKSLEKLFDISNFTAMTYEEQMDYLAKFHAELDRAAELEAAIDKGLKRGMEEGQAKGREEGRKEGRAEGRAEGREEGRAEGLAEGQTKGREEKAIEDATKLKAAGVALDIISQCTGVPMDILENL